MLLKLVKNKTVKKVALSALLIYLGQIAVDANGQTSYLEINDIFGPVKSIKYEYYSDHSMEWSEGLSLILDRNGNILAEVNQSIDGHSEIRHEYTDDNQLKSTRFYLNGELQSRSTCVWIGTDERHCTEFDGDGNVISTTLVRDFLVFLDGSSVALTFEYRDANHQLKSWRTHESRYDREQIISRSYTAESGLTSETIFYLYADNVIAAVYLDNEGVPTEISSWIAGNGYVRSIISPSMAYSSLKNENSYMDISLGTGTLDTQIVWDFGNAELSIGQRSRSGPFGMFPDITVEDKQSHALWRLHTSDSKPIVAEHLEIVREKDEYGNIVLEKLIDENQIMVDGERRTFEYYEQGD